jgi:hypothetical protein
MPISSHTPLPPDDHSPRRRLTPQQIQMIEEALCSLGEFGEVRLVVDKCRLRFLITQRSFDAMKWQPGSIVKDFTK